MDKRFFETFEQRKNEYAARAQITDEVRAEIVLTTGRHFSIERVVEVGDTWAHLDVRDIVDERELLSIALLYHQISFVQFVRAKHRAATAGFGAH